MGTSRGAVWGVSWVEPRVAAGQTPTDVLNEVAEDMLEPLSWPACGSRRGLCPLQPYGKSGASARGHQISSGEQGAPRPHVPPAPQPGQ